MYRILQLFFWNVTSNLAVIYLFSPKNYRYIPFLYVSIHIMISQYIHLTHYVCYYCYDMILYITICQDRRMPYIGRYSFFFTSNISCSLWQIFHGKFMLAIFEVKVVWMEILWSTSKSKTKMSVNTTGLFTRSSSEKFWWSK